MNGAPGVAYVNGGNIDVNGWQVQISGTPANGDVFTVSSNAGGTGDNRNALAAANLQNVGVLQNGTTSITAGVSALITGIGSQAQQINTAQTAQAAVNSQAQNSVQSISGVNLDEEAASLLQWQQAYQAAAQALTIGNSLVHDTDRFRERYLQLGAKPVRVTQNLDQTQFLAALQTLESGINQTQNQMSSGKQFTTASQNPTAAGAVNNYTQALGAEPAIRHQRQQRADEFEYRGQRAHAAAKPIAEPAGPGPRSRQRRAVEHGSRRHRDPGGADTEQLVVAGQYHQWQRRVHFQRLRGANPALHLERGGRDLQWRSGPAANTNCGGPDRGRRR